MKLISLNDFVLTVYVSFMSIQIDIDYSQMLEAGNGLPGGPGDSPVFEAEFATLSGQIFSFFAVSIVNRHAR